MKNFKFFADKNEELDEKMIHFHFELTIGGSQIFDVPNDFDTEGMTGIDLYNRLIEEFPSENQSIFQINMREIENPFSEMDITDIDFWLIEESYVDDNDIEYWFPLYLE